MSLRIEHVDQSNWYHIINLKVHPSQENFIESNACSIVESQYTAGWYPVGLYSNDVLVGFAMYGCHEQDAIWLDRFMIDKRYQGHGLGHQFLVYLLERIKIQFKIRKILLSFTPENKYARSFYERHGFSNTNEVDLKGELIFMYHCSEV
ncbi:GNAT family N-acetyltransferase [Listeria rocourtiae]|uniref:GNAT family N-acetyltransferase n=1 Tax=Listeria rocourtiae TaxID=647910 RepID=UPI0016244477|nr:GNAT family N-acetyltransferase [Listeria rocourtiae]MBC1433894.1 GNAT family N-acetyltransferase [Listeria rocourtiae]